KWRTFTMPVLESVFCCFRHDRRYFPNPARRLPGVRPGFCPPMQRIPLFLSGDLHALAEGRIVRYGKLDLSRNPVVSVLTGPLSTGPKAWPSAWRGSPPRAPSSLELEAG